jgi:predicted enzyme related to lactoylglutathione lyase
MENRVMHSEVQVDDLERVKKFYEKVFDWRIEKWMARMIKKI